MEIRGKTISYSSYKRKERDKIERDLLKDIDTLECNVNCSSKDNLLKFKSFKSLSKSLTLHPFPSLNLYSSS
jgi:hypothetical protein